MNRISKIAVFTSSRSEYEALLPLLKRLYAESRFSLSLIAGGAHLSEEMGMTIDLIYNSGVKPSIIIDFLYEKGSMLPPAEQIASLGRQTAVYFSDDRPDILILAGDRFELMGIASTALVLGIPVGHVSGGEITEGAFDNQVRNAVTKLSHLHFTGTEEAANNLIRMGEEKWRILTCGELVLDRLCQTQTVSKEEFCKQAGLNPDIPFILVTFHPETIDNEITTDFIRVLFEQILKDSDIQVCATASNLDPGGIEINRTLKMLSGRFGNMKFIPTLGSVLYYSAMSHSAFILGNSSGPLIEAQSFNKPVINVGKRQRGRFSNLNVLNSKTDPSQILSLIKGAFTPEFYKSFFNKPNRFGDGQASSRIIEYLKLADKEKLLLKKAYNWI